MRLGLIVLFVAVATHAHAGGLVIVGGTPRAIGRAGAATVGDDGGGALLVNPAAIARREGTRVQLGTSLIEDSTWWQSANPDAPLSRDQAGTSVAPMAAVVGSLGSWIVGATVATAAVSDRAYRTPVPTDDDQKALFDYRYSGIAGSLRRDTIAVGVSRRFGEAVALGVSVGASRVAVAETRRIWAGFSGVVRAGDESRDVELAMTGERWFVPSAVVGVLFAPLDAPIELGASVGWSAGARVRGDVSAHGSDGGTDARIADPSASLLVRQPVAVRAGARYVGQTYSIELGGDIWLASDAASEASWQVRGVTAVDPAVTSVDVEVVPSRLSTRTHGAVRAAVDVELIGGFLWASAGYAYTVGATATGRLSPSLGDLGGHTIGLGIEGNAGRVSIALGWSRTFALARAGGQLLRLDNPFGAGDASVPAGSLDGAVDQLGVMIDVELGAPEL
ncbi:MAG: outer membrane protein transport protein [Kofleriaceae bacterium]